MISPPPLDATHLGDNGLYYKDKGNFAWDGSQWCWCEHTWMNLNPLDYLRPLDILKEGTMKLNLALIQPYIDTNTGLNSVEIEGVKHYTATVIDVNNAGIHLQLSDDHSARLAVEGEAGVKAGAVVLFTADGHVTEIRLPSAPKAKTTASSTRSPDKALAMPHGKADH